MAGDTVIGAGRGHWLTIVGKDSLIEYPFAHKGEDMAAYHARYVLGRKDGINDLAIYTLEIENASFVMRQTRPDAE